MAAPPPSSSRQRASDDFELGTRNSKGKQRRLPVARVACNACHRSKRICSATRPCSRCVARGIQCVYEATGEQAQRLEALEGTNADLSATIERLKATYGHANRAGVLLDALRNRSDEDSALLLACLRVGDSWEQIVESFDLAEDEKLKLLAEMASSPNRKKEIFTKTNDSNIVSHGLTWSPTVKAKPNVHQGLPPWLDMVFGSTSPQLLSPPPASSTSTSSTAAREDSSGSRDSRD